ncbi:putative harbinger transposase-derived protein [Helianthus debilis subsp. tardiflorus]
MAYTQCTLQLLKLFRTRQTIKERNLRSFKRGREKILNRVLGFYKKKWHINEHPTCSSTPQKLRYIMYACILLHNMIIEDEGRAICDYDENASNGNSVPEFETTRFKRILST